MKRYIWLAACLFVLRAAAQEKLMIKGKTPNRYVVYKLPSEISVQSLSNQFGQSATKLSAYNGFKPNKIIPKGTVIKIPITEYNLIRIKGDGSHAPVYQIAETKGTLHQISKENKVSVAMLRQWNGLKTDALKKGQAVLIGYMVNARISHAKPDLKKEIKKPEIIAISEPDNVPVVKKEEPAPRTSNNIETDKTPVSDIKQTEPVASANKEPVIAYTSREGNEGYFAGIFSQPSEGAEQQYQTGDAAIFKSISGWADKKYYVLTNNIPPETIVRITAPNNKTICAKVLGSLQETKEGNDLLLRMSNSAASALGITDTKFTVKVTYYQ